MNTNSNSYTIIYASVMVVIVAFLLAFVSSSLRETQNKNVELDTKKQILAALNIKDTLHNGRRIMNKRLSNLCNNCIHKKCRHKGYSPYPFVSYYHNDFNI